MQRLLVLFTIVMLATAGGFATAQVVAGNKSQQASASISDAKIRQILIQQSLASYPGPCPCPYNAMRNGRACGARSVYSKPGSYEPLCYPQDVTTTMVRQYRAMSGQ